MKILVACEFSGTVRDAFIGRGHDAMSCDILPTEAPGPHYEGNVLDILDHGWDLMVAHPPCTYLTNSGAKHLYRKMKKENGVCFTRWRNMINGIDLFRKLLEADIPKIAIENPIMHGHAKSLININQSQTIQPWQFGHKEMKATCLWLKGLPLLEPTNIVGPPPNNPEERKSWAKVHRQPPGPNRWKLRSKTYQGIANAMSHQWK